MGSSTPIKWTSTNEDPEMRIPFATTKFTNANLSTESQNVNISGAEITFDTSSLVQTIPTELPENLFDSSMHNITTHEKNVDENNVDVDVPNINLQHPIDPTVLLPNEQFLFKRNFFPYENQNSGKELRELLRSWNCEEFYSELMRNITLAIVINEWV